MRNIYKLCSIIYRLILIISIPLEIIGNLLSATAGHNRAFDKSAYITFAYIILTVALLTFFQHVGKEKINPRKIIRYILIPLLFASICFEIYTLYSTLFKDKNFTTADFTLDTAVFLFMIVTSLILHGVVNNKI
jgi:pilus assembly protein TadC